MGEAGRGARLGIVFSGGPAPGGHNVALGMLDCLLRCVGGEGGEKGEAEGDGKEGGVTGWSGDGGRGGGGGGGGLQRRQGQEEPEREHELEHGSDHHLTGLVGFVGGPLGLVEKRWTPITRSSIAPYRNQGGFDLLGSGRLRLETRTHFEAAARSCRELRLDGLVIVGGDDSNTNAAYLAEYFSANGVTTAVVGVPKTIDNDMRGGGIPISFGFDSASKVYSEMIGNVCSDARSCRKYWHFIRIMGRRASHLTLECALQCRPNIALVGEEIAAKGTTLREIVDDIASLVTLRGALGLHYGVVLIPEGLLSFIPEVAVLMEELNEAKEAELSDLAEKMIDPTRGERPELEMRRAFTDAVRGRLSPSSAAVASQLPDDIFGELLHGRDSHGNVSLSSIDTEELLAELVGKELNGRHEAGRRTPPQQMQPTQGGATSASALGSAPGSGRFRPMTHFCGYEGRAGLPTNFDATYAYALGYGAATLAAGGAHSTVAAITNLTCAPKRWHVTGVPLCRLMRSERRAGKDRLVIRKMMVDLNGPAFARFASERDSWRNLDHYSCPGPTQFDWSMDDVEVEAANHLPMVLRLASGGDGGGGDRLTARDGLRCTRAGAKDTENVVEEGEDTGAWAA